MNNEKIVSQWQMTDVMAKLVKNRNFSLSCIASGRPLARIVQVNVPAPVADVFSVSTPKELWMYPLSRVYLLTNLNKKFDFPN